ncbi:putative transcription factor bZIP family [Helianthus annuus]|uniref:Transcription factor bZIP family n=1 Tax=Helianthus annuus TaxID=4232 RepID=A0A9K3E796_HELAN|nr:putative transcription factor bZIP family [Helianthus annuus]KAJ0702538.1 putative transcription factor bZIP family [Helianthus annuus]KAJ0839092.1 putative transcription factor bZIP family [Helianthus annuus]
MGDEGMVKIELEAAEALAGLARCKDDANNNYSYEEKSGVKDEQSTKLRLNGRRSRQNLTEAEIEARKIRRVLANRESARQTIRRRQAVFEELTRKAVDLAWENENLKRDKDTALKQYDSLKTKNECLKAQMPKNEETREESSTSSTNSPFIIYKQPSFLPFVWPTSAGIVFPSRSSSCDSSGTPLYLLPYPWLLTLPQQHKQNHHPHSFNLNDKPKESSEPEKSTETHGGGGGGLQPTDSVSCEEPLIEHDTCTFLKHHHPNKEKQVVGGAETHQVPGKRSADTAAASEARKRRKQLTRLKNHFNCRQLRMH